MQLHWWLGWTALVVNVAKCAPTCADWGENLQNFEDKIFSQNGEDGVLLRLLEMVGVVHGTFVEFGVEDGTECNTRILRERLGMTGLLMDGGNANASINLQQEFITAGNVLELFDKYDVAKEFDVLSLDVDMFDLWILRELLAEYRPRVMVVETNPTLGLAEGKFTAPDFAEANTQPLVVAPPSMMSQEVWDLTRYYGANPAAFRALGKRFGYEMVYCERCGTNCFLVDKTELLPSCKRNFSLPRLSYPCFGTSRTGGAHVGHEVDTQRRQPILLADAVLDEWLSADKKGLPSETWAQYRVGVFPRAYSPPPDACTVVLEEGAVALTESALESSLSVKTCTSRHFTQAACVEQSDLYYTLGLLRAQQNDTQGAKKALELSLASNARNHKSVVLAPLLAASEGDPLHSRVYLGTVDIVRLLGDKAIDTHQQLSVPLKYCSDPLREATVIARYQGISTTAEAINEMASQIRTKREAAVLGGLSIEAFTGNQTVPECLQRWVDPLTKLNAHCARVAKETHILLIGPPSPVLPILGELRSGTNVQNLLQEISGHLLSSCEGKPGLGCPIVDALVSGDIAPLDDGDRADLEAAMQAYHRLEAKIIQNRVEGSPVYFWADSSSVFSAPLIESVFEGKVHMAFVVSSPLQSALCSWTRDEPMTRSDLLKYLDAWERHITAGLHIMRARDGVGVVRAVRDDGTLNTEHLDQFINFVRPNATITTYTLQDGLPRCAAVDTIRSLIEMDAVATVLKRLQTCYTAVFVSLENDGSLPSECPK